MRLGSRYSSEYAVAWRKISSIWETLCWYSGEETSFFHVESLPKVFQCWSRADIFSKLVMYMRFGIWGPEITEA